VDASLITALAGVLGSASGASAAIVTTWISQKSQTTRERAKWETRKRETLYGDFITEASHLIADALDYSLDKPETLVKLYANLGRIRLVRRRSGRGRRGETAAFHKTVGSTAL
jgi:hypothetical protein